MKDAVARRFSDESISVREAAVSLVGSFVSKVPLVAETFHYAILSRLNDKGVSVRKRAVRIFRDVLLSFPLYRGLTSACSKMLQLAANPKEDESVRDLIHGTFVELWFSESSIAVEKHNIVKMDTEEGKRSTTDVDNTLAKQTGICAPRNVRKIDSNGVTQVSPCSSDTPAIASKNRVSPRYFVTFLVMSCFVLSNGSI